MRQFFTDPKDGIVKPTRKGIAMHVRRLPELAKAFAKALDLARERGLIEGDTP
jgi:hypothetical protein